MIRKTKRPKETAGVSHALEQCRKDVIAGMVWPTPTKSPALY